MYSDNISNITILIKTELKDCQMVSNISMYSAWTLIPRKYLYTLSSQPKGDVRHYTGPASPFPSVGYKLCIPTRGSYTEFNYMMD